MQNDNFMMSGNSDGVVVEAVPEEAKDPNAEIVQAARDEAESLQVQNLKYNGKIQRMLEQEIEAIKYWSSIGSTGEILAMDSAKLGDLIKYRAGQMEYLTVLLGKLEPFDD